MKDIENKLKSELLLKGILLKDFKFEDKFEGISYLKLDCYRVNYLDRLFNPTVDYNFILDIVNKIIPNVTISYYDNYDNFIIFEMEKTELIKI